MKTISIYLDSIIISQIHILKMKRSPFVIKVVSNLILLLYKVKDVCPK